MTDDEARAEAERMMSRAMQGLPVSAYDRYVDVLTDGLRAPAYREALREAEAYVEYHRSNGMYAQGAQKVLARIAAIKARAALGGEGP